MTPLLILLILSPPNEPIPPHGMPERGMRLAGGGSGMQHMCGITPAHFGPGKGLKVIKLFEEETLTD
eukprot:384595-Pyramimonas_sp.AAC.1